MADSIVALKPDVVSVEIEIAAPPERVFRALTDQNELFAWWSKEPTVVLSAFEMDARPGGLWRSRWKPIPGVKHGAVGEQLRRNNAQEFEAHGEVLEYEPFRLLVWTWNANWHEHPSHPTVVRWLLTPTAGGTLVRLTHTGLAGEHTARKDYGGGWQGVLKLLRDALQPDVSG